MQHAADIRPKLRMPSMGAQTSLHVMHRCGCANHHALSNQLALNAQLDWHALASRCMH
jgi:hypothetical protein